MSEELLQFNVVKYLKLQYPHAIYCASLGGLRTSMRQAKKAKATGYVKGFPDLVIYEPNNRYYGLFLEIKQKGKYPTKYQKDWINKLNKRGYYACCVKGIDDIVDTIDRYMNNTIGNEKGKQETTKDK
tara:strand:- start:220 stop:603 length:384 start_codon:yes stop_codon:yes gene_type:complete